MKKFKYMTMKKELLTVFLSPHFVKFCLVGVSGVGVNLGMFYLLDIYGLISTVRSAIAIEISIISNFMMNEYWTFKGRGQQQFIWKRLFQFQLVSLMGALIQWMIFIWVNVGWVYLGWTNIPWAQYSLELSWTKPMLYPPEIGQWLYFSQLVGIIGATVWNFLMNFYWTWGKK